MNDAFHKSRADNFVDSIPFIDSLGRDKPDYKEDVLENGGSIFCLPTECKRNMAGTVMFYKWISDHLPTFGDGSPASPEEAKEQGGSFIPSFSDMSQNEDGHDSGVIDLSARMSGMWWAHYYFPDLEPKLIGTGSIEVNYTMIIMKR